MMIIRGAQVPADVTAVAGLPGRPPDADPLQMQVAQVFADDLVAGRVASVRAIEHGGSFVRVAIAAAGASVQPALAGRAAAWAGSATGEASQSGIFPRDRPRIAYPARKRSASLLIIYTRDQVPETTPTSCGTD
ncbi:MAG: hypothetical protein ACLPKE_28105 [Streptosporangiaceae bacterium]